MAEVGDLISGSGNGYGRGDWYGDSDEYESMDQHGYETGYDPTDQHGYETRYGPTDQHGYETRYGPSDRYGYQAEYRPSDQYGRETQYGPANQYGYEIQYGPRDEYRREAYYGLWAEPPETDESLPRRRSRRRRRTRRTTRNTWTTWTTWTGWTGRRPGLDMRKLVPVAIPMAMALVLGMVLAMAGTHSTRINQSALGASASGDSAANAAAATGDATGAAAVAPGDQTPSPSPSPTTTATPAANAAANMNCELIVPDNPLSAAGLATPWLLTGPGGQDPAASGCQQSNANLQAFAQATILDPATGALTVYQPLVSTLGTDPAAPPVVPQLPPGAIVNIMIGFNGNTLQLVGIHRRTVAGAHCVGGAAGSLFGQVSYCNSVQFYAAARAAIAAGMLRIPGSGVSPVTGAPCPTTRSFDVVDQDPSDNVTTQYLLTGSGQTAQDNAANAAALPGATTINNGSDNRLLDNFLLPALGCAPLTAPDLSAGGAPSTSQTLDELSAMLNQQAPVALVPENDPMTTINGAFSRAKTNLYRLGVGQPLLNTAQQADTPGSYCANMLNEQTPFVAANMGRFSGVASPVPAMGNNLFTFLAARLSASFTNLNCGNFGLKNPVTVTADGNGVAVGATFNLTPQFPAPPDQGAPADPFLPTLPASGPGGTSWWDLAP